MKDDGKVREFGSGATRSSQAGRIDPEGFISPLALERYCEYLLKHQVQADGTKRDSDNWQKGMPLATYIKGLWRHFLHAWQRHRGWVVKDPRAAADIQEDLCAIIFNAQGYLHEILKAEYLPEKDESEVTVDLLKFGPDQVIAVDGAKGFLAMCDPAGLTPEDIRCSCCEQGGVTFQTCPHCSYCRDEAAKKN